MVGRPPRGVPLGAARRRPRRPRRAEDEARAGASIRRTWRAWRVRTAALRLAGLASHGCAPPREPGAAMRNRSRPWRCAGSDEHARRGRGALARRLLSVRCTLSTLYYSDVEHSHVPPPGRLQGMEHPRRGSSVISGVEGLCGRTGGGNDRLVRPRRATRSGSLPQGPVSPSQGSMSRREWWPAAPADSRRASHAARTPAAPATWHVGHAACRPSKQGSCMQHARTTWPAVKESKQGTIADQVPSRCCLHSLHSLPS